MLLITARSAGLIWEMWAQLSRTIGVISSTLRDAADYLGVNHFHNIFDVHFELLFPEQGATTPEARRQEKAAVLGWAKEIKTVRDPESHPPSEDMDIHDVVRQLEDSEASHDLLMQLAVRDLWERAEPKVSSEVAAGFEELDRGRRGSAGTCACPGPLRKMSRILRGA